MPESARRLILLPAVFIFTFLAAATAFSESFKLPPLSSPEQYGNILINRTSEKNGVKPVSFSHWIHRTKYTCRVCHLELDFNFRINSTEITEKANLDGKFCGACHNGRLAFGHTKENCTRCHNGDIAYSKARFRELSAFPKTEYGNRIDWVAAQAKGLIKPKDSLTPNFKQMPFEKKLELAAEKSGTPPAVFPHRIHTQWLDCSNCHPDIFNIKKKTTKHFSMDRIVKFEFCGVCHLRTAFPLDDCSRCHPGMK
ncbi:MAG: hypothetical protein HZA17_14955 [Nitrospirae bacterium]|nr:hypothetical protein [Nitrospirota bacterium]